MYVTFFDYGFAAYNRWKDDTSKASRSDGRMASKVRTRFWLGYGLDLASLADIYLMIKHECCTQIRGYYLSVYS